MMFRCSTQTGTSSSPHQTSSRSWSASTCRHSTSGWLTALETIERTRTDSTDLVARKGDEHEQAFLDSLIGQGLDVAVIPSVIDGLVSDAEAVEQTISAMRAGVDVIYQAALADGSWRGFADFLEKVPMPCPAFGGYSYEVLDTKLARHAKPGYLVQLCLYSDLLASVQGILPAQMHVILGSRERAELPAR